MFWTGFSCCYNNQYIRQLHLQRIQKRCTLFRIRKTLMIFDRHANLKYKYGSRHFWCRGYYVDTVGKNKQAISEYIRNQLVEDEMMDQMTLKEYVDPFTGSKNKKA